MHQTKKGNQWYFGMKAHVGVDSHSGLVRVVTGTAANVADLTQIDALLTGEEKNVHAGAGYTGAHKYVKGEQELHIAEKRGKVKAMAEGALKDATVALERLKAQLRARVEHPFRVLKCQFAQVPHLITQVIDMPAPAGEKMPLQRHGARRLRASNRLSCSGEVLLTPV
jgi:IS5 family transposase